MSKPEQAASRVWAIEGIASPGDEPKRAELDRVLARPVGARPERSLVPNPSGRAAPAIPGAVIGRLVSVGDASVRVDFPGNPTGGHLEAVSGYPVTANHVGCEVVLVFERGEPTRPVIIAPLFRPGPDGSLLQPQRPLEARLDGEQVVLSADKEIVLRCGKASITLTRAGKVLINGAYVLNRSSGVNRIKGGSVQIN